MAAFPVYDVELMAEVTGRPESSFSSEWAEMAFKMGTLLFKYATCLKEFPDDEDDKDLATYAIVSMADLLYLQKDYAKVLASPFTSESIGSYSYSKAAKQIQSHTATGVMWFDLAVQRLGVCDLGSSPSTGSIHVFDKSTDLTSVDGVATFRGPDLYDHLRFMGQPD